MDEEGERQRGLEAGRRWAEHTSAHDLATLVNGSFEDVRRILPDDASGHFVAGFREALLQVWRNS